MARKLLKCFKIRTIQKKKRGKTWQTKIKELLEKNGQMIIDGSMSTALEQMGANLNCNLWTARALVDTPELVKKVHTDYFKAGADCGITCSYHGNDSRLDGKRLYP